MFVVEVEIVKEWTDRGDNDWVTIQVLGDNGNVPTLDVEPERIIHLQRSLIEVKSDTLRPLSGSGDSSGD